MGTEAEPTTQMKVQRDRNMQGVEGNNGVHILAIPFPAAGHMLPHMDLIHQLLLRGITVTILVTPKNLHFLNPILALHSPNNNIHILLLPLPSHPSIAPGVENMAAMTKLEDPLIQWFQTHPSPPGLEKLSVAKESFARNVFLQNLRSWGIMFNTFSELDGDKMKILKEEFSKHDRMWAVGPLPHIKANNKAFSERGGPSSIPQDKLQMEAVALALEESGIRFIWAVTEPKEGNKNGDDDDNDMDQNVVPQGFEERVGGRGLVIKGWTPQSAILEHQAVADELGVAIRVCEGLDTVPDATKLAKILSDSVNMDRPERVQAMKLRQAAFVAIQKGGSSDKALDGLVETLSCIA
ncbi:hypothetical protein PTKIN_Ptkin17bG0033600 [Pterospermum kingtungense]